MYISKISCNQNALEKDVFVCKAIIHQIKTEVTKEFPKNQFFKIFNKIFNNIQNTKKCISKCFN